MRKLTLVLALLALVPATVYAQAFRPRGTFGASDEAICRADGSPGYIIQGSTLAISDTGLLYEVGDDAGEGVELEFSDTGADNVLLLTDGTCPDGPCLVVASDDLQIYGSDNQLFIQTRSTPDELVLRGGDAGMVTVKSPLSYVGDIDTGIWRLGADRFSLRSGGTDGFVLSEGQFGMSAGDVLFELDDVVTAPTSNPAAGNLYAYVDGDSLWIRDSSGTTTDLAGGGIGGTTGSTDNAVILADGVGGSTVSGSSLTMASGSFRHSTDTDTGFGYGGGDALEFSMGGTFYNFFEGLFGTSAGDVVFQLDAVATAPSTNPSAGNVLLYAFGDSLWARNNAGTAYNLAGLNSTLATNDAADDQMLIGASAGSATWGNLPAGGTDGCSAAGDKPLYTASTNSWSCGTDGGGADPLQLGDGSPTAPTYSFSAETDTGVYRGGTDNLYLVAGGNDSTGQNGNVNFGTYNDNNPFRFEMDTNGSNTFYLDSAVTTQNFGNIWIDDSAGAQQLEIHAGDDYKATGSAGNAEVLTYSTPLTFSTDVEQGVEIANRNTINNSAALSGDQWSLELIATLNDTAGEAGTQEFRMISGDLTTTDVTGWDNVWFLDFRDDGTSVFSVELDGSVSATHVAAPTTTEVYNNSGSTLPKCAAVYVSGFNVGADTQEVSVADADTVEADPAIGVVFADIPTASSGYVVTGGELRSADTSTGEAWAVGDPVYVNTSGTATTSDCADTLTSTKPTASGVGVQKIGVVGRVHGTNGTIEISGAGRANDSPNDIVVQEAAAPTVTTDGEIAIDSTGPQVVFQSGSTDYAVDTKDCKSGVIENLASDDDGVSLGSFVYAVTITDVGVHCDGTCSTTLADIDLQDRAGNAMTHGAPTVSTGTGNTTYTSVTAANSLVAGEGLEFNVANTPTNDGVDTYTITFCYTVDIR